MLLLVADSVAVEAEAFTVAEEAEASTAVEVVPYTPAEEAAAEDKSLQTLDSFHERGHLKNRRPLSFYEVAIH